MLASTFRPVMWDRLPPACLLKPDSRRESVKGRVSVSEMVMVTPGPGMVALGSALTSTVKVSRHAPLLALTVKVALPGLRPMILPFS